MTAYTEVPGGRNKRSVWTIPTQAYFGSHFATFPEALVEPCILAGTSAKGCCPQCGAPWQRVVDTKRTFESGSGRSGRDPVGKHGPKLQGGGDTCDSLRVSDRPSPNVGWSPTCECVALAGGDGDDELTELTPVPCTVLDPFLGSGTTAVVAARHGRNCIGIELNPAYVKMAQRRLNESVGLLLTSAAPSAAAQ
jgi:hypothetical protein